MKPKYSQNFLIDPNIRDKIVSYAESSILFEIGAGKGFLTKALLQKATKVIAIEKDLDLLSFHPPVAHLDLYIDDFLKISIPDYLNNNKAQIISNIPYHITTEILLKICENHEYFENAILMVQKEVAKKLSSKRLYSYSHAVLSFYCHIEILFSVSKNCFFPRPKVDSSVIKLHFLRKSIDPQFFCFLKAAFQNKRKKLASNVKHFNIKNIDPNVRADQLTIMDFLKIYSS